MEETAEVLEISRETVLRDWKMAKSWLHRELTRSNPTGVRSAALTNIAYALCLRKPMPRKMDWNRAFPRRGLSRGSR